MWLEQQEILTLASLLKNYLKGSLVSFLVTRVILSAPLARDLRADNVILVTQFKLNMNNRLMTMLDKQLLRKRAIIESVIEQLKHISQIEHSRHRSPTNFVVNLLAGLIAYCHRDKKPSIAIDDFILSAST